MQGDDEEDATTMRWAYDHANYVNPQQLDSLGGEAKAAVGAITAHVRHVAATATAEAQLSGASLATIAALAVISLLLVVSGWLCVVAAGVWLAIENGMPVALALLIAAAVNLAVVAVLLLWGKGLLRHVGFSRTLRLVFPGSA